MSRRRRYDDDREVAIVLKDGTTGVVRLGDIQRAIDSALPRLVDTITDNAPTIRKLLRRGRRTRA
jgi:hypothetical protein